MNDIENLNYQKSDLQKLNYNERFVAKFHEKDEESSLLKQEI
jgi:hypothetical protein